MTLRTLLLVVAIVAAVLCAVAASGRGDAGLTALAWLGVAVAALAGSLLA